MVLKVSAAPIYFHDCQDDGHLDDCEICEHSIHNQNAEFSIPPQFQSFENDSVPTLHQHESYYESVYITTLIIHLRFGRPPPYSPRFS